MEKITVYPREYINPENKSFSEIIETLKTNKSYQLIIGEVQSGKTWAIINLIKSAIENNFKYIFLLGGFNTFLQEQTLNRIIKEIPKKHFHKRINEINNIDDDKYGNVFVLLKSKSEMQKMFETISGILNIRSADILIIDDEADYASINTKTYEDPSAINEYIHQSYLKIKESNMSNGGLISVTATPNAILVNKKHKIIVDDAWVLKRNKEYTGLKFFNDLNNFYICMDDIKFSNILQNIDQICFTLLIWLIKTFLYFQDSQTNHKSDLLIYIDDKKDEHKNISKFVTAYLNKLSENNDIYDLYFQQLLQILKLDKFNFMEFKNWLSKIFQNNQISLNPLIFNSDNNKDDLMEKYNNSIYELQIVIGGNYLSRGFTFENILVELFTYSSENNASVDTLLQRCRWFGYRKKNNKYKYMNVVTNNTIKKMLAIAENYNNVFNFNNNIHKIDVANTKEKLMKLDNNFKGILGVTNHGKQ